VAINGQQVLANFDILANAPKNTAYDRTFITTVTGGAVSVSFTTLVDNAKVSAIEVVPSSSPPPTTVRVNAGGPAYASGDGRVWQADTGFNAGRTTTINVPIAATSDPTLYQTERYGNFTYAFSLPNGNYAVTLRFAEIYWTSPGQRVFNVSVNAQQVLSNFDILANVSKNTAYDRTFSTTVSAGTLSVAFSTIVDNAKLSAIDIVRVN
jgi:hypothetical protein